MEEKPKPEKQEYLGVLIPESKKLKLRIFLLKQKKDTRTWVLEQIEKIDG